MMARVPGKRLIPTELLRRSTRGQHARRSPISEQTSAQESHGAIKQEPKEYTPNTTDSDDGSLKAKRVKLEPKQTYVMTIKSDEKIGTRLEPDGLMEIDQEELDLERTLLGGQSFRWIKENHPDNAGDNFVFTGTISNNVLQIWRCDTKHIAYRKLNLDVSRTDDKQDSKSDTVTLLSDYFQLQYKLKDLYKYWSTRDENFDRCSKSYEGFRILRQDPVENVFCFICATNNNIKRISLMVNGLCRSFGERLTPRDQVVMTQLLQDRFYAFPKVERLAQSDVFDMLRYKLGFGYRAKFIHETAKQLMKISAEFDHAEPRDYLMSLRQRPYVETCKQLQGFAGVGRKVADCICLMSMDHLNSVPIDCHIYEIVCRSYMKTLRQERKSLTEKVHDLIGDFFVELHGPLAGWATSVLFVAELKHLKQKPATNKPAGADKKACK